MRRHFAFFIARENACIYFALLLTIDRPANSPTVPNPCDLRSFVAFWTTNNYVDTHVAVDEDYRNKILCVGMETVELHKWIRQPNRQLPLHQPRRQGSPCLLHRRLPWLPRSLQRLARRSRCQFGSSRPS